MKKIALLSAAALLASAPASAEYLYGYGNISVNYLDWSKNTQDRTDFQEDFAYLELEGGAGFDWGEVYGFFDLENVQDGSDELRTAYKGTIAYKIADTDFRLYGQHYATDSKVFAANNTVLGGQYRFQGDGWFVTPWVGAHMTITNPSWNDGFTGFNGGMFGWTAVYNFTAWDQKFWISNWHESEFARKSDYTDVSGETDDVSMNGALAFWWDATEHVTTGVQYRYAYNKLGTVGNQNAFIYSLRYNF
ncbi:outer membrane protein OmpK [Agarivorans sp. Alg241-V36]|uniref:outer membrane protein OmpK n=1 Tax=Agarivorans sp. Alg241-V36 TaxID=2305992 RepID=UPI0013D61999|nr:outer membrane protein OmpK [Agarivorans sp. Alg241-V36]